MDLSSILVSLVRGEDVEFNLLCQLLSAVLERHDETKIEGVGDVACLYA